MNALPEAKGANDSKLSLCIVSHNAYGVLKGNDQGFIGGAERLASVTARWLSQRGHRVSMLTWNEGGPQDEIIDGIRVIKICRREQGLRGLRFFHPKWTGLVQAMRKADADIYYQNLGECVTGQVAAWCRWHHRAFVFALTSDSDCDPKFPELHSMRERILYRYGLRRAHCRIAQTETQRRGLRDQFGLDAISIPMPSLGTASASCLPREGRPSGRILWLGRVCKVKRPDRLLDLAVRCPDLSFDIVGPMASDDAYAQQVAYRAKQLPNVRLHGRVPRVRVEQFYQEAACLCSTSEYEGFPNTFLEAWSHGLPVVSTIDPDDLIARQRLGFVAGDLDGLGQGLRKLLASLPLYKDCSTNAVRYFLNNHTVERIMPRLERALLDLAPAGRRTACLSSSR